MIIGVPRERKILEKRIALTPDGALELTRKGHTVLIETGAGAGAHFPDEAFRAVGCEIVPTLEDVWTKADIVTKVKEPHEEEYKYLREGLILFDYLHLASMPDLSKKVIESGVTSIAYELVSDEQNRLPLLDPMSEVAGKLSVINGQNYLLQQNGGRGVLLGGTMTTAPRNVLIVGAGISGRAACEMALGLGARVTVLDINKKALENIKHWYGNQARTILSSRAMLDREMARADLVIGAVLVPGAAAPKVITKDMIKSMKRGSVFVDISIDQGGCSETSRPMNLDNPIYEVDGVLHFCVCNMPTQTARTSTLALADSTLPFLMQLADHGLAALDKNPHLRAALHTHKGNLTNFAVAEAIGVEAISIDEALKK